MPNTNKKFNSIYAARLSLLLTLSLTVGIGTAIYAPLGLKQRSTALAPQVTAPASTPVTADFGQAAVTSTLDFSSDSEQNSEDGSVDDRLTAPQIVQTTEAPILTTTQGS
ncbi:hypothetical protein GCM10022631_13260 [Deinococcus rubellus]|uniref:hypothetical protein n=1 Tax=Deinococcus rubellus TaxID=1889240 RepID=UPI0031E52FAB